MASGPGSSGLRQPGIPLLSRCRGKLQQGGGKPRSVGDIQPGRATRHF